MGKTENDLSLFGNRKPWLSLISLLLIAFGGLIVGQFVAIMIVTKLYHLSFIQVMEMVTNISEYPDYKVAIYILQGLSAVFAFILAPWFFLRFIEKKRFSVLSPNKRIELLPVALALLISLSLIHI